MRAPSPPLNALRAFEAFARHASMTRAAAELCVTHGAVSRQVRALQDSLGVTLVEGPRTALRLTLAGRDLAGRLTPAFAAIGDAVASARPGAQREIEISCLGTFALKWLIPRLSRFMAARPDVRIRVSESYALVDFARETYDGAIRIFEADQAAPRQQITPFMAQHQGPVAAPHLTPPGITLSAFGRLPRLYASTFRQSWQAWSDLSGVTLPPASVEREFGHNHSMVEAAIAGLGVAVAPWAFVAPDIDSGRLVAPFGFQRRTSQFVFLRPEGKRDDAVDAFRDWLAEEGAMTPPPPIPSTGPVG